MLWTFAGSEIRTHYASWSAKFGPTQIKKIFAIKTDRCALRWVDVKKHRQKNGSILPI
jgi:hypothetical protein